MDDVEIAIMEAAKHIEGWSVHFSKSPKGDTAAILWTNSKKTMFVDSVEDAANIFDWKDSEKKRVMKILSGVGVDFNERRQQEPVLLKMTKMIFKKSIKEQWQRQESIEAKYPEYFDRRPF